jgi:hypothetical protein
MMRLSPALVFLLAAQAQAATVIKASIPDLVQSSAVVVHAVVRSVDMELGAEKGRFRTAIDFEVLESLKGLDPRTVDFHLELPGGRVGDRTMAIPGMPTFAAGDEVVMLLERTATGYALAGLSQGVFKVDRRGGVPRVIRDFTGLELVGKGAMVAPPTLNGLLEDIRRATGGVR